MESPVEPVTDRPYSGIRPPPDFIVPASYYYAQLYRNLFELVDKKISDAKDKSDAKVADQGKLGQALSITKRLSDVLGGSSDKTLDTLPVPEPRLSEALISLIEMNYALEELRYIGSNREDGKPLLFGNASATGAIASPPLTEEQKSKLEVAMWLSDDFRKLFVDGGPQAGNLNRALDMLAKANPAAYADLNTQWVEMRNAGADWKTESTEAFWTRLKATLQGEAKWFVGATAGGTNYDLEINNKIQETLFKRYITAMESAGHPVAYGATRSLRGLDMQSANGLLTTENNILSQLTQQAVQDFQQQISKQANYMNAIAKVLDNMLQLLRKLMP